jgi:hypothetical protein
MRNPIRAMHRLAHLDVQLALADREERSVANATDGLGQTSARVKLRVQLPALLRLPKEALQY